MKHYFLGTAAGFSREKRKAMRRIEGTARDVTALREYLKSTYGGSEAIALINGRSGIALALKACCPEPGEVVINGFTCFAVVSGVRAAGFTPVYADIRKTDLNFGLAELARVVTPQTRAVIVQNTLGNMVDIREIEAFCQEKGLVLIEDLAHCVGRRYPDGREAGTVGAAAVFSFGKEKSVDVCGGGAVVLKQGVAMQPAGVPEREVERRARKYPTYGARYRRLSYLHLNGIYMRFLLEYGKVTRSADGIVDYMEQGMCYFQAKLALTELQRCRENQPRPLREFYLVRERKTVLEKLRKAGYYFDGFWYERPVSPERYFAEAGFNEAACPVATEVAQKIVNLPNYYSEKELLKARKIIEQFAEKSDRGFIGQDGRLL